MHLTTLGIFYKAKILLISMFWLKKFQPWISKQYLQTIYCSQLWLVQIWIVLKQAILLCILPEKLLKVSKFINLLKSFLFLNLLSPWFTKISKVIHELLLVFLFGSHWFKVQFGHLYNIWNLNNWGWRYMWRWCLLCNLLTTFPLLLYSLSNFKDFIHVQGWNEIRLYLRPSLK